MVVAVLAIFFNAQIPACDASGNLCICGGS